MQFQILRKFLIPAAIVQAESADTQNKPCRPSELPLYEKDKCACSAEKKESVECSALEGKISVIRKELWICHDQYRGYREKIVEKIEIGKAHTESTLAFLKEEGNYLPRIGAISLGGLTGIIFGLRGGWLRRLTYGTTGSLAMSALCYPRQASEVTHEALTYAKKYIAVTYNFIYGVKPGILSSQSPNLETKLSSDLQCETSEREAHIAQETKAKIEEQPTNKIVPGKSKEVGSDLYARRSSK